MKGCAHIIFISRGCILGQPGEYITFGCSPEIPTSLLFCSYETLSKAQCYLWFEGCVVHPFLKIVFILLWIRMGHQRSIYLALFMFTCSSLSSLPSPRCLHPLMLRCLVLCSHQEALYGTFPCVCCHNIPKCLCGMFLEILTCPSIAWHLRNRGEVVSFS